MPSHRANRYGTLVEEEMADRYRLELDRASWRDACRRDGRPVEIKAARLEDATGRPGRIKIYERYHRELRSRDGYYVLACYRPRGSGLEVLRSTMLHASRLPRLSWHGGGEHRDSRQATVSIDDVDWS